MNYFKGVDGDTFWRQKDTCIISQLWVIWVSLDDLEVFMNVAHSLCALMLTSVLTLSGCSVFKVYTIDLPQGTPITAAQAAQVRIGMSTDEVLYLLGSPAVYDTLNPDRMDYLYDYTAGTDGRRAGKKNIKNASQYLTIYLNNGQVVAISGQESLPERQQ